MTDVAGINAAAGSSDAARRIQLLQDGGHQWMDPQTQVAMASGQTSDSVMMSAADQFKGIMNDAQQTVGSIYHDPVLQKTPSFASTLSQWVGSNVGYLPIEQPDLSKVQQQLQAKGFGVGLPTDGTWDSAWHDQFNQAHYQEQLNNQANTGQVAPPHKVAHGFLASLMPSHAIPALWGLVKSTPGDIRSLAADVAGGSVSAFQGTVNSFAGIGSSPGLGASHVAFAHPELTGARIAASVENVGNQGKQVTPQDILDHPVTRAVNDLSTLMMFLPLAKAVTPLARSLGEDVLRGTVKDAFTRSLPADVAQRGPGIIASSLNRTLSPDARLIGKALDNTPFLRQLYPHVMQPTLAEDGWYYATRRALAQPMRNPLINLGARTAEYTNLLGAETQGVAYVDTRITGKDNQTQIAKAVHNEGVISGATGTALDWALTLGKPTLGMKPSAVVGSTMHAAEAAIHGALGDVNNVPLQWDRAMEGAPKEFNYQPLVEKFGVIPVNEWFDDMLNTEAAGMAAKARMQADIVSGAAPLDPATDEWTARFKELTHAAWNDPKLLGAAKSELLMNSEDMMVSFMKQRVAMLSNAADGTSNLEAYFKAKTAARELFAAHGDVLVHPGVWAQVAKDRAALSNENAAQDAIPLVSDYQSRYQSHKDFLDAAAQQEGNPAVKVREPVSPSASPQPAAPGVPPVFHGSTQPLPDVLGDRYMGKAADNLFGPGLYTTDSEKIAKQYARGGVHYNIMSKTGAKPKVFDLDKTAPGSLRSSVRSLATDLEPSDLLTHVLNDGAASSSDVIRALREHLASTGEMTKSEADEILHEVTQGIEDQGYDALSHRGGLYASKSGEQHQVYIWLHPDQMQAVAQGGSVTRKMTEAERETAAHAFAGKAGAVPAQRSESIVPTRSYVKQYGPPEAGRLGIAKLDTVTSQQARVVAINLAKELKQAGLDPAKALEKQGLDDVVADTELGTHLAPADANEAVDKIRKKALDYLILHGTDMPTGLSVLDPAQMVARVLEFSKKLSADVSLPVDATADMRAQVENLKRIGYKPVWGTDIGHHLSDPIVNPAIIRAHSTLLRKVASGLGMNTEHFSTQAPAIVAKQDTLRRWQEDQNDGKLILTAGFNAARMYKWIQSQVETQPLGTFGRSAFQLFRRTNKAKAELLVANGKAENMEDAYHIIQTDLGATNTTFATMGRKQFVDAAMAVPDEVKALNRLNGFPEDTPLITRKMAELMHRQAVQAAAARPMSMMGLSKFEDVFRASMIPLGVGKVAGMNVPALSSLASHAAVLPNDLIRARDALKFKFSPIFSARRVAKTNVKMATQHILPTLTPLKDLANAGVTTEAMRFLDTIYPEDANAAAGWDATDRFLNANDIFGYSPRHFQAYSAWELKKQGMNPVEIRKVLDKVFTYGDRTALERSMNTIWYPFSFEKSVYKLLGGYLLDNGTQRMALQAGLSAYHAVDQHAHIQDWLDKHLPVARELEKLNAFTQGVGLGQFGGINAPLLNMFMPQHNKQPLPEGVLKAAVPAWNDLSALLLSTGKDGKPTLGGEIGDTAKNTWWFTANQAATVAHAIGLGSRPGLLAQHQPAETAAGQNQDGWQLRNALITGLSSVIDYNYHNPNAPYVFGSGDEVPPALRGVKIDRTSIGVLTQRFFPLFDPSQAAPLAEAKAQAAKTQIAELTARDPQRGAVYRAFQEAADKVNTYNTHGAYDTSQLAQITQDFRQQAIALSETDSQFLKFYNTNYLRLFGPIENVTGG